MQGLPVAGLKRSHIKAMIGHMEDRPQAANSLLKRLKTLLNFAADIDMIPHKPLLGMRGLKVSSDGFHTWTEEEIAQHEATHAIGGKARVAMALMLYTGQHKSDAVKMGWQHIKDDTARTRPTHSWIFPSIPS